MSKNLRTRRLLLEHYQKYPKLQIQDIFKFIFQSSFGCEHMITSLDFVIDYIIKEAENTKQKDSCIIEQLDGSYSRVHLSCLKNGLCACTLGKLFYASAKKEDKGLENLIQKLDVIKDLILEGLLPFSIEDFNSKLNEWSIKSYPALHHSNIFREEYNPSYRVIADKYIPFISLFTEIDKILEKSSAVIIINDKNLNKAQTLIDTLLEIYNCSFISRDELISNCENYYIELNQHEIIIFQELNCNLIAVDLPILKNKKLTIIKP